MNNRRVEFARGPRRRSGAGALDDLLGGNLVDVALLADAAEHCVQCDRAGAARAVDADPGRRVEQLTGRVHPVGACQHEVVHADVWAEDLDVLALLTRIQDRGERRTHDLRFAVLEGLYRVGMGIEFRHALPDADGEPEVTSVVAYAVDQRDR